MNRLASTLLFAGLVVAPLTQATAQQHLYDLTNGSLVDQNGTGPNLVADGLHACLIGTGCSFAAGSGYSLSNVFSAVSDYSIVLKFDLTNPNTGFEKIVDFKDKANTALGDHGYYDLNEHANFYNQVTGPDVVYTPGDESVTVLTRNASTNVFTAYVNGVEEFHFTDSGADGVFSATDNIAHFFEDDLDTNHENGNGEVACIATYNSVLSASDVAALGGCGSVNTAPTSAPEPASLALLATGFVGLAGVGRKLKARRSA